MEIKALMLSLLEEEGQWDAARAIAARFFRTPGDKFVTEFRKGQRWFVVQWVTTSSSSLGCVPLVYPGRVGISWRRRIAFHKMANGHWLYDAPEPVGFTVAVRFLPRLGRFK